ncbi:hypothetical protein KY312_03125 [Candidatus Woesearchaeota archaeon]|nr:hypothetical protein [Candidatus Woesearchaeota archaeon]
MPGIGHLGELEVIDYLRKEKKHTIYLPLKDVGIDFISTIKDNFFQIQVKTSMFQKNSYFWFDLYKKKMVYSKHTFYVFVCKSLGRRNFMGKKHNFIIIPSLHIKKWIKNKKLAEKTNTPGVINVFIYPDKERKKWTYKNKGKSIDFTKYWNNFDQLK